LIASTTPRRHQHALGTRLILDGTVVCVQLDRKATSISVREDTVSRVWRKVKSDGDAWNARSLAEERSWG
jgi:hypothetical protein